METQRLFIAISLPEFVKDGIARVQSELREAMPGDFMRWTKRDQFHLTLRFLGEVDVAQTEALANAVHAVCLAFPPLHLSAASLGFFPNARRPRVLWAGVDDSQDHLRELHLLINAAVKDFTREKAESHFAGHVTLARIQNIHASDAKLLSELVDGMSEKFFGEWVAAKLDIIRSELSSHGARYQTVAEVPFGI